MRVDTSAVRGGAMRRRRDGRLRLVVVRGAEAAEMGALIVVGRPGVAVDGGRSVATGADGSASGRKQRERSEARR